MRASNIKQTIAFSLLCVAAPMAFVMYALTYPSNRSVADLCSTVGFVLFLLLFAWSLWSLRRHRGRAIVGLLASAAVFWLLLIIPGYVKAKEVEQLKQPAEQTNR
jgi:uncharacterized membrane protein